MGAKRGQGGAKLTARRKRQGKHGRAGKVDGQSATLLTTERVTRAYKPRARQCANKACRKLFTPQVKHGKFCCDSCRQAEARRRKKKGSKVETVERDIELVTCLYCHNTFFGVKGSGAKYCSNSHRELAYRQRRDATISAFSIATGMTTEATLDLVSRVGLIYFTRWLKQKGFCYNDSLRQWLMPVSTDIRLGA